MICNRFFIIHIVIQTEAIPQQAMDEQQLDLRSMIKQFLSKEAEFRNPAFDPAPYLIQILKDKSADHESLIQKQEQLIEQQNKARQIVDQICAENSAQFMKFLQIPAIYAENLQKLKSNVHLVKKKVKQTKALLLNTQKDIQQIHFNCMFNKRVHKQLKGIELRLQQYETAYLALKNNQYYLCALNLPYVEGLSILQSTLVSRAQTLRLRMMSKAIDELNNFLFFSPKIVLISSNALLDRMSQQTEKNNMMNQMIANWDQQEMFFKRYKLFKKAACLDYLAKIWVFNDLERREGKLGLMYDIIKGIIRIGKISQITSSIEIYGPKQISNTFLLLKCFRVKQQSQQQPILSRDRTERWFIDRCSNDKADHEYISAVLNIVGVLLRKAIIIHKIYEQFEQKQFNLNSAVMYKHILAQLKKLLEIIYFPQAKNTEQGIQQNSEEQLNEQLRSKLINPQNYINYGYSGNVIAKGLQTLEINVASLEEKEFNNATIGKSILGKGMELLSPYSELFYNNFHRDFMAAMEQIYCKQAQSFITESFDTIVTYKPFKSEEIKFMKGYKSQDRKAIKQYVFLLSFLKTLEEYFHANELNLVKLYKYLLMAILFFYLKQNYHIQNTLIKPSELLVIEEQRKTDKRIRKKEEQIQKTFYKVLTERKVDIKNSQVLSRTEKRIPSSSIGVSFHTTDKLKIIQRQNHMLLSFSCQFFVFIEEQKNNPDVEEWIKLIIKLEPTNYDEQIKSKLVRVWETLPEGEKSIKQFIAAVLYKLMLTHCLVIAKIYRETGTI